MPASMPGRPAGPSTNAKQSARCRTGACAHHGRLRCREGRAGHPRQSMCAEWAAAGLQINGLAPGYIATDLNAALLRDEQMNAWVLDRIPARRWGPRPTWAQRPCGSHRARRLRERSSDLRRRRPEPPSSTTALWRGKSAPAQAVRVHGVDDLRLDTSVRASRRPTRRWGHSFTAASAAPTSTTADGSVGVSTLRQPMVLGHEVVGVVAREARDGSARPRARRWRAPGPDLRALPLLPFRATAPVPRVSLPRQRRAVAAHRRRLHHTTRRSRRSDWFGCRPGCRCARRCWPSDQRRLARRRAAVPSASGA